MSKKSRQRNKARRDAQKRSRRDANRAMYAAMVGTAANRKKKKGKAAGSAGRKHTHPDGACGNGACRRCHSSAQNNPWHAARGSCLFAKRWTSSVWRNREP